MKNDTETKIIITINGTDGANHLAATLMKFCEIASTSGDSYMHISHGEEITHCGFVGNNLSVRSIVHQKPEQRKSSGDRTYDAIAHANNLHREVHRRELD